MSSSLLIVLANSPNDPTSISQADCLVMLRSAITLDRVRPFVFHCPVDHLVSMSPRFVPASAPKPLDRLNAEIGNPSRLGLPNSPCASFAKLLAEINHGLANPRSSTLMMSGQNLCTPLFRDSQNCYLEFLRFRGGSVLTDSFQFASATTCHPRKPASKAINYYTADKMAIVCCYIGKAGIACIPTILQTCTLVVCLFGLARPSIGGSCRIPFVSEASVHCAALPCLGSPPARHLVSWARREEHGEEETAPTPREGE